MSDIIKFEDLDCEDLKPYCPWEGQPVACYGGEPVMCEGKFCKEAYSYWLEDQEENERRDHMDPDEFKDVMNLVLDSGHHADYGGAANKLFTKYGASVLQDGSIGKSTITASALSADTPNRNNTVFPKEALQAGLNVIKFKEKIADCLKGMLDIKNSLVVDTTYSILVAERVIDPDNLDVDKVDYSAMIVALKEALRDLLLLAQTFHQEDEKDLKPHTREYVYAVYGEERRSGLFVEVYANEADAKKDFLDFCNDTGLDPNEPYDGDGNGIRVEKLRIR